VGVQESDRGEVQIYEKNKANHKIKDIFGVGFGCGCGLAFIYGGSAGR